MINTVTQHGRIAWVGNLKVQTLTNNETKETFEKKTIDLRLAVPKSVAPVKVVKDGVETMEVPTEFFYWQATGQVAQVISDHCSQKDENGKIISREVILTGHQENFIQEKTEVDKFEQKTKIDGKIYAVPCERTYVTKTEVSKNVVERMDFCGPKIENKVTTAKPVEPVAEEITEAKLVVEGEVAPPTTGAASVEGTVVTEQNVAPVTEAPIQVPEGYNGEVAPF